MTKQNKDILTIVSILTLAILAIIFVPLATIWSLNTLFALNIPIGFDTWAAALILGGVVGGTTGVSFKK
jgi:hypothetical protein